VFISFITGAQILIGSAYKIKGNEKDLKNPQ